MSGLPYLRPRELRAHEGSEAITVWCPTCIERTTPHSRTGVCMWCDTPLTEEAIAAAAAQPQGELVPFPRRRERHGNATRQAYTNEQILARIVLWEQITGVAPAKADWNPAKLKKRASNARGAVERILKLLALYELGDFPSETTVRKRFGSMNAAIAQAGFDPRAPGRQKTTGKGIGKPKIGRKAMERYIKRVLAEMAAGDDDASLKEALYNLSLSAFWWAERLAGTEEE